MYWQYCSIMMSMTLIWTSVLPFEPTGPGRALLWATWTYSHVSDSPSFAPTPFHKGRMVASAQPLCSSAGRSRKQVGFCISSLRLVTHHFVRSKGIRWRRGCCVCGPEDPGKKRNILGHGDFCRRNGLMLQMGRSSHPGKPCWGGGPCSREEDAN